MIFNTLDDSWQLGTAVALSPDQTTNPNREERKMRTDGHTLTGNEMAIPRVDLGSVKEWAKDRMTEVGLAAATLVMTGYLGSVLLKGIETYSMSGF